MLKITKGKLLQDDLTSSWRHLQYEIFSKNPSNPHFNNYLLAHFVYSICYICISVVCVAVFTSCQKLCFIVFFVAFYCIPFLLII